jgi:predicted RNA-binding Zn-ribbon protein involved in translation (DUF1610 family)
LKVTKKAPGRRTKDRTRVLVCPDCGGTNIRYWSGYQPTGSYVCNDCHYRGAFIIQRQIVEGEDGEAEVE